MKERTVIDRGIEGLKAARGANDAPRIKQAIKALDSATQAFAARRMDANIRRALAGHKLEEFSTSGDKPTS